MGEDQPFGENTPERFAENKAMLGKLPPNVRDTLSGVPSTPETSPTLGFTGAELNRMVQEVNTASTDWGPNCSSCVVAWDARLAGHRGYAKRWPDTPKGKTGAPTAKMMAKAYGRKGVHGSLEQLTQYVQNRQVFGPGSRFIVFGSRKGAAHGHFWNMWISPRGTYLAADAQTKRWGKMVNFYSGWSDVEFSEQATLIVTHHVKPKPPRGIRRVRR